LTTFKDLGLAEPILKAVLAEGHSQPTPIQSKVIPVALAGRDVVGIAQTGTGKTAAFVLPILHRIVLEKSRSKPGFCPALILAPTRELAAQIAANIVSYGRNRPPKVAIVVGGVKPGPQIRVLRQGVDIIVATPGRLLDHMRSRVIDLSQTDMVVLDEADQMLDLGFMPAIRDILSRTSNRRQTILLSATMPKPIRSLAAEFLSRPEEIMVSPQSRPIERIAQTVVHTGKAAKSDVLIELLKKPDVESAIVFTRTKHGADRLSRRLDQAGLSATAIHGNKSQGQRDRAIATFRKGGFKTLVATDIAARGIDIDDISHIFNYELPNVPEVYVHRIGRTARAGKSGIAISLCDPSERGLLRDIERLIGVSIAGENGAESDGAIEPVNRKRNAGSSRHPRAERTGDKPAGKSPRRTRRRRGKRPAGHGDIPREPAGGYANDTGLNRILSR
jgi:ATP-dependent RNA helicase RhlE